MTRAGYCIVSALLTLTLISAPVTTSVAAADSQPSCATGFGTATPVLLVHGFNSDTITWKKAGVLEQIPRIVTDTFAYGADPAEDKSNSFLWVTDPRLGPALARKIGCLASASRSGGGNGKVVVIAHSLGGLVLRCSVAPTCNGHQEGIADEVAAAVTFGTPHLGSFLRYDDLRLRAGEKIVGDLLNVLCNGLGGATLHRVKGLNNICTTVSGLATSRDRQAFVPGSAEQQQLPEFPKDAFPVLAVAGRVRLTESVGTLWHRTLSDDVGDLVVGTDSALAESRVVDGIGGRVTIDCGSLDISRSAQLLTLVPQFGVKAVGVGISIANALSGMTCTHGSETSNAAFLAEAIKTIRKWQAEHPIAPPSSAQPAPVSPTSFTPSAPPSKPVTRPSAPHSAAGDTTCDEFVRESTSDQVATVAQMIKDYGLSGPVNGSVEITYGSARAMCSVYPPNTPIRAIYGR